MTLVAVLLAAAAAALAVGAFPRVGRVAGDRHSAPWRTGPATTLVLGLAAGALVTLLDGTDLAVGLVALGAATGVLQIWRRGRRRRTQDRRRAAVVEVGEALVGELRAGRPVVLALERGREVWPEFGPVAGAARLGADVPAALRRLAAAPGAEGLREVAAAWQVSERSGATLSSALGQVVESARVQQATAHLVRSELASAQATARLVACLPVATLAMSSGIGADPWGFLLHEPAGLACLASGVGLILTGLWWIDRIAAAVTAP
jgi:tight adherence protein B